MSWPFEHTYSALAPQFSESVQPTQVSAPRLLALNEPLARELGLDPDALRGEQGAQVFSGNLLPEGSRPVALAYAGHQFGGFVPRLGDGRAILLGELRRQDGRKVDVQLKGAGPTPFSRGGDGRAALGPVLREYLVSESMAALGVPTSRALAAVSTGEVVVRDRLLPGAVLTRVAASHLRIGTFQYFAARRDVASLALLTRYALARHYPERAAQLSDVSPESTREPALALFDGVLAAQASLVAHWLSIGFVHGVMNTDNTAISGETLDYGPCAFLDAYDPKRKFSSIDAHGRYAFGEQPAIAGWNLARFAETLLPLVDGEQPKAIELMTQRLDQFEATFDAAYEPRLRAKFGLLDGGSAGDVELAIVFLRAIARSHVDFTLCFRRLASVAEGAPRALVQELFTEPNALDKFWPAWQQRLAEQAHPPAELAARMRQVNPAFIPRNHQVEAMIAAATQGDLGPFERLLRVLARPYDDQPDAQDLAAPPGEEQWGYKTFCGT